MTRTKETTSLDAWRREIDIIDGRLVSLLNRRARFAMRVGKEKRRRSSPVRDSQRERLVLEHVAKLSKGPVPSRDITSLFKRIISLCRRLQNKVQR